jgi:lipopolysaccharide transport system ATP-binding protein
MSPPTAVSLKRIGKHYRLYQTPGDRFKEAFSLSGKKYHDKFYALRDIDLDIRRGEVLAVLGKNGSGKTTLLSIIAGILQPNEGRVIAGGKICPLLNLGAGFNPDFTGRENISFYRIVLGYQKTVSGNDLEDIIAFAELGRFIDQPLRTYSKGMALRLAFAVAISTEPDILVIDEVLAVGDQLFQRKCYSKIQQLMDRGTTVVLATHNLQVASGLCTHAVLLDGGMMVARGEPKQTINAYQALLFPRSEAPSEPTMPARAAGSLSDPAPDQPGQMDQVDRLAAAACRGDAGATVQEGDLTGPSSRYIEGLKPKSTCVEKNYDVDISHITLRDQRDERVNLLRPEGEFFFCYRVLFGIDVAKVTFAITFRNEKGFPIGWSGGHHPKPRIIHLDEVSAGDAYSVKWRFVCTFLPGPPFFIDAGVVGLLNEQEVRLCFIKDALAFKVAEFESPRRFGGVVQFGQDVLFSKVVP